MPVCTSLRKLASSAAWCQVVLDRVLPFRLMRRLSLTLVCMSDHIGNETTVNDVVFAAFAGAVRRYCLQRAAEGSSTAVIDAKTFARAMVSTSFPSLIPKPHYQALLPSIIPKP